jgi:hypothetical protein
MRRPEEYLQGLLLIRIHAELLKLMHQLVRPFLLVDASQVSGNELDHLLMQRS